MVKQLGSEVDSSINKAPSSKPSDAQQHWLRRGLSQPGGKLPLFDEFGQSINERTVKSCIVNGWAEPWYSNPLKPDWIVCKLTDIGRSVAEIE